MTDPLMLPPHLYPNSEKTTHTSVTNHRDLLPIKSSTTGMLRGIHNGQGGIVVCDITCGEKWDWPLQRIVNWWQRGEVLHAEQRKIYRL